jgi:hypothetical protein
MGLKVKKTTNTKKEFSSINNIAKKIKFLLKDKDINKKDIKIL